jgi:hypothetical protein
VRVCVCVRVCVRVRVCACVLPLRNCEFVRSCDVKLPDSFETIIILWGAFVRNCRTRLVRNWEMTHWLPDSFHNNHYFVGCVHDELQGSAGKEPEVDPPENL